jgi:hypothetical protein
VVRTDGSAGPPWKKSSWSAANGHCVEVAELHDGTVAVRDSKDNGPGCPILVFPRKGWNAFLLGVNANHFDPS